MNKHKMFNKGIMIKKNQRMFLLDDMEDRYAVIRSITADKQGALYYGKRQFITLKELDTYIIV